MFNRYRFGEPIIDTEAILNKPEPKTEPLPYFRREDGEEGIVLRYTLEKGKPVYGLGQNVRGINKRGFRYVQYCKSFPQHTETLSSMYGAHNFIVVTGENTFGIFVDSPGCVIFDVGFTNLDELVITSESKDIDVYLIKENSVKEIVKEFRKQIGQSYIPPRWAFGFQQCRWGYQSTDEVRNVVYKLQEAEIPFDSIGLDIDYMDQYKNFTVDPKCYGDLEALSRELGEQGIRLVPIVDAGTKVEEGYDVYDKGIENGYFLKDESGKETAGVVWPGRCYFPDFLRPEVRRWFGDHYKYFTDMGIEGFWNDMNEPTIYFTDRGLTNVVDVVDEVKKSQLDIPRRRQLLKAVSDMKNNRIDYKAMYHEVNGQSISHDEVHNLYGYYMARAASEQLDALLPNHRTLIFSRSSYIGMHRYAGIWQGDNHAWWQHILLNMKMMPSLNMCGLLFAGADVGGFHEDTSGDLLVRWTQLAVFTPLMRNHSTFSCRRQEPYLFEEKEILRDIIRIRYMLLPYIYSEFVKCALESEMMFRPLAFDYPEDERAAEVEDQLMYGDSLMIAPIYNQNSNGRYVYLPEDMVAVRISSPEEYELLPMKKGDHYISAELNQMVFFIRENKILPIAMPEQNTDHMNFAQLTLLSNVTKEASYKFYNDDGFTKEYKNPSHYTDFTVTRDGADILSLKQNGSKVDCIIKDVRS